MKVVKIDLLRLTVELEYVPGLFEHAGVEPRALGF